MFVCLAALLFAFHLAPDLQEDGLKALERKEYPQAEQIFTKLIAQDPKDYSAFFNLALAESLLNKPEQAAEHYKQTLALKPKLYEAELNLGLLYLQQKQYAEAIPHLQAVVEQKPNQLRSRLYLADAQLATNQFPAAQQNYEAALKLDAKSAPTELGLGQSLMKQGKLDEALPHYNQAAVLDASFKEYLVELSSAFEKEGRKDEAISLLKQFPENVAVREQLGQIYLSEKKPDLAIPEFAYAVEKSPTTANQLALATAYLQNKQPDQAAPLVEKLLAANPNDFDLQLLAGRLTRDHRDFRNAANRFLAAAKLKPDSDEAWSELAGACIMAELYPQALMALDQVRRLNAEKPGHFFFRAIVLDKLQQPKPALESYQKFLALSQGKSPDEEFKARQRVRILEKEVNRR